MSKKVILATLIGAIVSFFLGWLIYGIILGPYYDKNMTHYEGLSKAEPFMWTYIISSLATAWLLAFIFDTWSKTYTFLKGVINAIIICIPITLSYDMFLYGTMNLYRGRLIIADLIGNAIYIGITGGIIALSLVMLKGKNEK